MASSNGRAFVLQVIEKYKQHPYLWQVTHDDYHDKAKRNRALDEFIEIFRAVDPQANRETVQKKLSSLRASYGKELRKIKASLSKVSDPENVHVPKLWYFNHLNFLQDQDTPQTSKTVSSIVNDVPFEGEESGDLFDDRVSPISQHSFSSKSFKRSQPEADQVLEKIAKQTKLPISTPPPQLNESVSLPTLSVDKAKQAHDAFGEHIAERLRSMPTSMVPYCQKIINDAIFLAEMQSLNISSRIVTKQIIPSSTINQDAVMAAYYTAVNSIHNDNEYENL